MPVLDIIWNKNIISNYAQDRMCSFLVTILKAKGFNQIEAFPFQARYWLEIHGKTLFLWFVSVPSQYLQKCFKWVTSFQISFWRAVNRKNSKDFQAASLKLHITITAMSLTEISWILVPNNVYMWWFDRVIAASLPVDCVWKKRLQWMDLRWELVFIWFELGFLSTNVRLT